MPDLHKNIRSQGGIYKRYASSLEKLGIINFSDFLYHIPSRYDDFSLISKIKDIQPGETVTIRGIVTEIKNQYTRNHFTIQKGEVKDETGTIEIVWFNQPYITRAISKNDKISISGKAEYKLNKLTMANPSFEIGETNFIHTGRLVPIYPETRGISSKWIRRQTFQILNNQKEDILDILPNEIIERNNLENLYDSLSEIHFPNNLNQIETAKKRLSFDELFFTQLSSNMRKMEWQKKLKGDKFEIKDFKKNIDELIKSLPFNLTNAQKRTLDEIFLDLSKKTPMNRLLQGDVGSGKTIIAGIIMYLSFLNGRQSLLMAPTEILANQHHKTISNLLTPLGVKVGIQTGNTKSKEENLNIIIGTHAIISKNVKFKNLSLIIIDEQQRFGVEQRAILKNKGNNPHLLTMTATPIPRTMALTLYGDLDLSVLDEMPKGRKEIKTWVVPKEKREGAYDWIKKQIKQFNSQVFIICPFIEESESAITIKSAVKEFETLKKGVFKNYKINLLHGKIKSKEKDLILKNFKDHKFDILVATPVVEVGIDIPGADIILIEGSERFGLSQLHQLRGRVGRNDKQAYCLLFSESDAPQTNQRLKAMEKTNIGAELAEFDLKIRGAGDIYGTRQSGRNILKIASLSDLELIQTTKKEAENVAKNINKYPEILEKLNEGKTTNISRD